MSRALRGLPTYLVARVLPALASMGLSVLCIHALAPADYSRYSITMLAVGVAAGFAGGLAGQPMLRHGLELAPHARRRGLWGLPLACAALVCPAVALYFALGIGLDATALLALAAVPALAVMDTRRNWFVAGGRAGAVLRLDAVRAGSALLLGWALLHGWGAVAAAPVLAQAASVLLCLLLVPPGAGAAPGGTRTVDARYVGYGLGLAGWMAVIVGLSLAERTLLAADAGLAASGRYAAQADVVNAVFAAAGAALAASMMPAYLAQGGVPDAAALRRLRRLALGGVAVIAAGCLLLGAGLAWLPAAARLGRVQQALTGDVPTALALVAAAAAWTAAGFVQKPIELRGRTQRLVLGAVLALGLFLLIAPPLAARCGPIGVAGAKLLAGLAYCGYAAVQARATAAPAGAR